MQKPIPITAGTTLQTLTKTQTHGRPDGAFDFTRKIPAETGYDLVVAGGGPAGTAAAVCAARRGLKVLLVEATACLGGMGTSGLVTAFDPMANGEQNLVAGFMLEVVETLYARGFIPPGTSPDCWRKNYLKWTPFKVEGLKLILDEKAVEAGVEIRFFTRVADADADAKNGVVRGVILDNVEGLRYVKARAFIDATGDAALAVMCGAPAREPWRDTPRAMPATLPSLHAGIDWNIGRDYEEHAYLPQALADNFFTQCDRHLPGMSRVGDTLGYLNGGHLFNLNALRCRDLSDGAIWGRKIVQEYLAFYKKYVPGCANIELVTTASLIGLRESRRIVGEYELTAEDYFARRKFPDQIGIFNKFIDIHVLDTSEEEWARHFDERERSGRHAPGEFFGLPYGILVPRGWRNLWVAGRCVSSDVKVHGSLRVQPAASMLGQAAGVAAAQSLQTGQPASDLDTAELVATLRQQNANLPQKELSKKMTRS